MDDQGLAAYHLLPDEGIFSTIVSLTLFYLTDVIYVLQDGGVKRQRGEVILHQSNREKAPVHPSTHNCIIIEASATSGIQKSHIGVIEICRLTVNSVISHHDVQYQHSGLCTTFSGSC